MKRFFTLLIFAVFSINIAVAQNANKDYTINFNGNKYHLLYSVKNKDFGGYLNEYYKKGETYNIWTELVAVHHFPNAYSPIDRIKDFKDYLGSMHVPSSLTFDDKRNTAMIDFIIISDRKMPIVLEFNVFKYEKSKKCGSVAIQYAKRYAVTTTLQIETVKRDFEKNRKQIIKKIKNFNIPEVITEDIDKCISASDIIAETKSEQEQEKTVSEVSENELTESEKDINNKENDSDINTEDADTAKAEENITENNIVQVSDKTESEINNNEGLSDELSSENKTENDKAVVKKEEQNTTQLNNQNTTNKIEAAPVPETKVNKKKEKSYQYINDKSEYISSPRTKKELKAEIKQKKESAKKAKKSYEIKNTNSDLIAKPRTKKELKKLKKEAKERIKEANKRLN